MDYAAALALLDDVPIGLVFADANDVTVLYNREAQRIMRRTPERVAEIVGTSVIECHSPQSRDTVRQLLDDFRTGRRDEQDGIEDVNGRPVRITYRAVRSPDGQYLGIVEIVREVEAKP
ncbi:MAG: PAS domain-containing protein [Chloroflexi bacterium]|nr:PAS domain-containing protein [Chloroflexota bacterium]MBU1749699.1 PAS domain-containing protein [Chloroflexota bacterium]